MEIDNYLKFLHNANTNEVFLEREKITKLIDDKSISDKDILLKKANIQYVICPIEIDDSRELLIKDLPSNFLSFYTITLGDKTNLISFKFKSREKTYICDKKLIEDFEEDIDKKTLKSVDPISLKGLEFKTKFDEIEIIKKIKKDCLSKRKINLNKIHVTNSKLIELFIPNIKNDHLKLSKKLNLILRPLFKNNYFRETSINIYDISSQTEIIKPFYKFIKKEEWEFDKDTNNKIYHDLRNQLFLKVDLKIIEQKLNAVQNSNPELDKIKRKLEKIFAIQISSNNSNTIIPIWKTNFSNSNVEIESGKHFNEITGKEFKLDFEYLKNIYIIDKTGKEASLEPLYLNSKYNDYFEKDVEKAIKFESYEELYIKLLYFDNVEKIIEEEKINLLEIEEIFNLSKKILRKIVKFSVDKNLKPKIKNQKNFYDLYFLAQIQKINQKKKEREYLRISYESYIFEINKTLRDIVCVINNLKLNTGDLFFLLIMMNELIEILEETNKENSEYLRNYFNSYFKEYEDYKIQNELKENLEHKNLIEFVNSCAKSRKVLHKKIAFIETKKKFPFELPFLYEKIESIKDIKKIKKIDTDELKVLFPKSFERIFKKIKETGINQVLEDGKIIFGGRNISIDRAKIITEIYVDERVKKVVDCSYFNLYLRRDGN